MHSLSLTLGILLWRKYLSGEEGTMHNMYKIGISCKMQKHHFMSLWFWSSQEDVMMGISCSHLELVNIQLSNEAIYHFLEKLANPQICVSGPVERGEGRVMLMERSVIQHGLLATRTLVHLHWNKCFKYLIILMTIKDDQNCLSCFHEMIQLKMKLTVLLLFGT